MAYSLVLVVHVMVALFLVVVVLLQGGRGGMAETMGGAAAQSLFGGGANIVMTKLTAAVAALFMVTCVSLAVLSTARGRSVTERLPMSVEQLPAALPAPKLGTPPQRGGVGEGSPEAVGRGAVSRPTPAPSSSTSNATPTPASSSPQ